MACVVVPLVFRIKNRNDFDESRLKLIASNEVVTICGIKKNTVYEDIKAKIFQVIPFLDESNVLVVDLSDLDVLRRDDGAKCLVTEAMMLNNFKKKICIRVICKEKLHRVIRKFGVEVFTPEVFKEKFININK